MNRLEDIDPAILRLGRLATHIEIGLPNEESRQSIFQATLRGIPHVLDGENLAWLAKHTRGLTGAELQELVDVTKRSAAKRNADELSLEDFPPAGELKQFAASKPRTSGSLPISERSSGQVGETFDADDGDESVGFQ